MRAPKHPKEHIICKTCGEGFDDWPSKRRMYCSARCYKIMCNSIVSTGFYLQSKGVTASDLSSLPCTLGGLPKGVVQRLSAESIICRTRGSAGRIYRDRAVRVVWQKGHNFDRLQKWMEENEVTNCQR